MQTVSQWATTSYFYPRSPRGERRKGHPGRDGQERISIHAPREGSDGIAIGAAEHRVISIHAPREGSDVLSGGVNLG